MANQLLALQVQRPVFDYPNAVRTAQAMTRGDQEIAQNDMGNQLAGLKLRDASHESNALMDYRTAQGAGDPKAIDKLKAYPEIQAKLHQAFESMKPDDKKGAIKRAEAFGNAARYVLGFPEGQGRIEAWNKKVDELHKAGYIDDDQADNARNTGPNEMMLDEALTVDAFVKQYRGGDDIPESTKEIEDGVAKFRETITPRDFPPNEAQAAEIERRVEEERARLGKVYGTQKSGLGSGGGQRAGGKGDSLTSKSKDQERLTPEPAPAAVAPAESAKANAAQQPLSTKRPRAVNKQTGETIEWDGKSWVPVK